MAFTTLIDTATLESQAADPAFVVLDCRFSLEDPEWGRAAYAEAHLPGALHVDLNRDLSSAPNGRNGRHPIPSVEHLRRTFGRLGIDAARQVVAYDHDTGMFAARLWWLLRWLGHDAVAVLDGGFARWVAEGRPTSSRTELAAVRHFVGEPRPDWLQTADDVEASIQRGDRRIVDARAPQRFSGAVEPIDRVGGHIPGARNYFFKRSLDEQGRFLSRAVLREQLTAALDGAAPEQTICYCGSGVTACHNLLAMEHAGLRGGKLYAGSWSEWSSDPRREVETSNTD
jgi:thiosulfate/3-mercaptopyruvate sulfurtransferase